MAFSEIIHSVTPKNVRRPRVGQKGQIPRRISELLKAIRKQTTRKKLRKKKFHKKMNLTGILNSITFTLNTFVRVNMAKQC